MRKFLLTSAMAVAVLTASSSGAFAYYSTSDYPEWIEIQSNQSAFAIPVVGDTKSTQTSYGSKNYLEEKKVASKRFQVPHSLIRNPGWASDYYVPAVKLIIVDRTPYMREWRDEPNRGTSREAQGFAFQSREGINIGAGISIAAMVKEEDAALFLYWFGTKNTTANPSDPAANFASVSYGKSLQEIMDTVVRGSVQAELSSAFMKHSFTEGNARAAEIMETVRQNITKHFAEKGITVDYMGYSGPLNYSDEIQKSIDRVFVASQQAQSSAAMMTAIPYLQAESEINFKNAQSDAIRKWNGSIPALPSSVTTVGQGWVDSLLGYVGFGSKPVGTK